MNIKYVTFHFLTHR